MFARKQSHFLSKTYQAWIQEHVKKWFRYNTSWTSVHIALLLLQCGFYRLPSSRRRVREMVDVVGRLGNASRRQPSLAHRGSPTLEAGFGKTRAALA
ncbi:hypothetical protein TNCV_642591 [Trichonephila clavipes]|nr:hypothetical protein TNCV_642591 [Trichonephila clavipes]